MGIVLSGLLQSFPPTSKFSVDHIPDLTGQVIIVTGATSGAGYETAKALLQHNAKVYLAVRSEEKAKAAIASLKEETGSAALFLNLDLSDLKSVKRAAEEFQQKEPKLHVLFNNAGVMVRTLRLHLLVSIIPQFPPRKQVTAQGYDLQWGTNVLGHYYLTTLLLPTLLATAPTTPSKTARVINTSSFVAYMTHLASGKIDLNTLKDGPARKKMDFFTLYAQSKLGNVVFTNELVRRYGDQGIVSVSVNPGNLKTELLRHMPSILRTMADAFCYHSSFGALTQLWAGTTETGPALTGKFLAPWAREGPMPAGGDDLELGKAVWVWLEEQVEKV
ncbi:NAD(P)-binding protein [Mycena kentingensis (nom. inval.)]|nr:NAD(P)-binding protein [Mycena kentingensis (nom. inval.)]